MKHRRERYWGLILSVFLSLIVLNISALARAEVKTSAKSKKEQSAHKEKCTDLSSVKVTEVSNADMSAEYSDRAGLGEDLLVKVECLPVLLKEKADKNKNIILFLNGIPIKGGYPPVVVRENMLRFRLERTMESDKAWNILLGRPNHYIRPMVVSVGLENDASIVTNIVNDNRFKFVNIRKSGLMMWGIFALLSLVIMIYLARKKAMLRVYGPKSPYSLAFVQMAFWTYLSVVAYVFLWFINGTIPDVTASILTLLGIGSGTALGARLIDENKLTNKLSQLFDDKEKCEQELEKASHVSPKDSGLVDSLEKKLKQLNDDIAKAMDAKNTPSKGFLMDILNDKDGMALHRFQIVVWTIVLGMIFVKEVYTNLGMPEFSETMLILVGISSGAYLGFKFPEEHVYGSKKEEKPEKMPEEKKPQEKK